MPADDVPHEPIDDELHKRIADASENKHLAARHRKQCGDAMPDVVLIKIGLVGRRRKVEYGGTSFTTSNTLCAMTFRGKTR